MTSNSGIIYNSMYDIVCYFIINYEMYQGGLHESDYI